MWEVLIAAAPVFIMLLLWPETSESTILYWRARRLRQMTGNPTIRSAAEVTQTSLSFADGIAEALLMPARITALDPAILFANIYMMLVYGIYYSFFESSPLVYGPVYGFNLLQSNLAFLPLAVGTVIALILYTAYLYFYRVCRFNGIWNYTDLLLEASKNSRRIEILPRASPHPSNGELFLPADRPAPLRLVSGARPALDSEHDRSRHLLTRSLHHLPRNLPVPAQILPAVRSEPICRCGHDKIPVCFCGDTLCKGAVHDARDWWWMQSARGVDDTLHFRVIRSLLLRACVESKVEVRSIARSYDGSKRWARRKILFHAEMSCYLSTAILHLNLFQLHSTDRFNHLFPLPHLRLQSAHPKAA